MTPEVSRAIEELTAAFPASVVEARALGDGGASVTIGPVDPGEPYMQRETWMRFGISFQYPYADIYPLFVRPDLARADGAPLGEGMTSASFEGVPAIQISRRNNKLDPATDTAALKVAKVLEWLRLR